jgi:SOS-response transcriptional repressor LexA
MDSAFIKRRFEEIAQERRFSVRWLSDSLSINRYSINKLLEGEVRHGKDEARLRAIIAKLGYTEDQFFKGVRPAPAGKDQVLIPMYGEIPAGHPTWFEGTAQAEEWVPPPPGALNRNLFALRVKGQSMAPQFLNGDVLYLEPLSIRMGVLDREHPTPRLTFERLNGRVVAALVDEEATLKKLEIVSSASNREHYQLKLVPLNPEYQTITIGPDSTAHFQGVVAGLYRDAI